MYDGIAPRYELSLGEMGRDRRYFPFGTIETAFTGHTANSIAFRFNAEGKVLVYSGDAIETEESCVSRATRTFLYASVPCRMIGCRQLISSPAW